MASISRKQRKRVAWEKKTNPIFTFSGRYKKSIDKLIALLPRDEKLVIHLIGVGKDPDTGRVHQPSELLYALDAAGHRNIELHLMDYQKGVLNAAVRQTEKAFPKAKFPLLDIIPHNLDIKSFDGAFPSKRAHAVISTMVFHAGSNEKNERNLVGFYNLSSILRPGGYALIDQRDLPSGVEMRDFGLKPTRHGSSGLIHEKRLLRPGQEGGGIYGAFHRSSVQESSGAETVP